MITQKLNFAKPRVELAAVGGQKKDDLSKMLNNVKGGSYGKQRFP